MLGEKAAVGRSWEGVIPEKGVQVDGVGDFFTKEKTLLEDSEFFLPDSGKWKSGGDTSNDQGAGGEVLFVGV